MLFATPDGVPVIGVASHRYILEYITMLVQAKQLTANFEPHSQITSQRAVVIVPSPLLSLRAPTLPCADRIAWSAGRVR